MTVEMYRETAVVVIIAEMVCGSGGGDVWINTFRAIELQDLLFNQLHLLQLQLVLLLRPVLQLLALTGDVGFEVYGLAATAAVAAAAAVSTRAAVLLLFWCRI